MDTTVIASSTTPDLKRLSTTGGVLCLILLAAAYVTNAMDRQMFPTLLPMISAYFGFRLEAAGFVATVFNLGLAIAGVPAGYLLDRWSRKSMLVTGMIIYSVLALATVSARGLMDMASYRALTGVGEALQITALYVAAGSYFYKHKAFVVGCIHTGYGVGSVLGPLFATRIALAADSWKPPYVAFFLLGLTMAAVIWFVIPRAFTEQKGQNIADVDRAAVANMPERLLNRNTLLCAASVLILGTIMYGFMGLYPTFLRTQLNFPPIVAATAFGVYGFGCMFPMLCGYLGDRFSNRGAVIAAYSALSVVTYLIYNVATLPWHHYVLSFLMAFLCSSTLHVNNLALLQRSMRPQFVGRVTGVFTSFHFLGGAFAGYWFGLLVNRFGWSGAGLIQETMLPLLGVCVMLFIKPDRLLTAARHRRPEPAAAEGRRQVEVGGGSVGR